MATFLQKGTIQHRLVLIFLSILTVALLLIAVLVATRLSNQPDTSVFDACDPNNSAQSCGSGFCCSCSIGNRCLQTNVANNCTDYCNSLTSNGTTCTPNAQQTEGCGARGCASNQIAFRRCSASGTDWGPWQCSTSPTQCATSQAASQPASQPASQGQTVSQPASSGGNQTSTAQATSRATSGSINSSTGTTTVAANLGIGGANPSSADTNTSTNALPDTAIVSDSIDHIILGVLLLFAGAFIYKFELVQNSILASQKVTSIPSKLKQRGLRKSRQTYEEQFEDN